MTNKSNEYQIDDLRELIRNRAIGETGEKNGHQSSLPTSVTEDAATSTQDLEAIIYRELVLLDRSADYPDFGKPYLRSIPDSVSGEVLVFDWLEFLLHRAGYKRTLDFLRYYHSIGWLSEAVQLELRDYLLNFDDVPLPAESNFNRIDHMLSLLSIAKLAALIQPPRQF